VQSCRGSIQTLIRKPANRSGICSPAAAMSTTAALARTNHRYHVGGNPPLRWRGSAASARARARAREDRSERPETPLSNNRTHNNTSRIKRDRPTNTGDCPYKLGESTGVPRGSKYSPTPPSRREEASQARIRVRLKTCKSKHPHHHAGRPPPLLRPPARAPPAVPTFGEFFPRTGSGREEILNRSQGIYTRAAMLRTARTHCVGPRIGVPHLPENAAPGRTRPHAPIAPSSPACTRTHSERCQRPLEVYHFGGRSGLRV
jgi:hypothetical protein